MGQAGRILIQIAQQPRLVVPRRKIPNGGQVMAQIVPGSPGGLDPLGQVLKVLRLKGQPGFQLALLPYMPGSSSLYKHPGHCCKGKAQYDSADRRHQEGHDSPFKAA